MKQEPTASGKEPATTVWGHLRKILVPTDFSGRTDKALSYAIDLARRYGAEVHLLHVIPPLEGDAYSPPGHTPEAAVPNDKPDKLIYDLLASTAARHDTGGVRVELSKQRGMSVAGTIFDYAHQEDIDLIVIGTRGVTGVKHLFLGSVAEEVVHHAPCHVLVVHERERERPEPGRTDVKRILVPVDFSASSIVLFRHALQLAVDYGAELDLLHVVESPSFLAPFAGVATLHDLVPDLHDQAEACLARLLQKTQGTEVPARIHVTEGRPAAGIIDFAQEHGTDLIVIATRGLSGMKYFFLGSVTERVVRAASCPVLSIKTHNAAHDAEAAYAAVGAGRPG